MLVEKEKDHENGKNKLSLIINGIHHKWTKQYISGADVRKLGSIDKEDEIFLAIKKPWEDEPVSDETKVDLARPGVEHFYSKKDSKVIIYVDGTDHSWDKEKITFKEVIILAYGAYKDNPDIVYTVVYEDGPKQNPEGSMIKDSVVFVKNKMNFHATETNKS